VAGNEKKKAKCPPIPAGFEAKFTGPAYYDGMTPGEARSAWYAFVRLHRRVTPMPRQDRGAPRG
jgi:hypothetical protein